MKTLIRIISLILLLLENLIVCERIYEKIDNLCERCKCVNHTESFQLNCQQKNFQNVLSNWPQLQQQQKFIGIFSNNNLTNLERFPPLITNDIELIFSSCNVKNLADGLFESIPTIKLLDLSYNQLTNEQLTSDKFKGPYNNTTVLPIDLEYLNLAYNQIHSLNKNIFEHLQQLKQLNLEGNDFVVFDLHTQLAISSTKTLQYLNLANNELTELVDDAIIGLNNLTELNLATNQLDFVPKSLINIGKSLKILNISNNPIIDLNENTFIGLDQLNILYANNLTTLKFIGPNTFIMLKNLKKLHLSNNNLLEEISREAFNLENNRNLEEFFINNNRLEHIDYKLLNWTKLRVFEFNNNPLDCYCDLFNITKELINDIRCRPDGPTCHDQTIGNSLMVFDLDENICWSKPYQVIGSRYVTHHFTVLRISLMVLSIVLLLAMFVAGSLGYTRFRKYHRNRNYPFVSQVLYNPLSTTATGRFT